MKHVLQSKQWFRRSSTSSSSRSHHFLMQALLLHPSLHTQLSSSLMTTNWCGLGRETAGAQKIENAVFESGSQVGVSNSDF